MGQSESDYGDVGFDGIKFLALDRFMDRLGETLAAGRDVDELQIDFMERCDQVLLKTVTGFVTTRRVESLADPELREHLASRLDLALEESVSMDELIVEALDLLEEMEDVAESWLSVVLFGSSSLSELHTLVSALGADSTEILASRGLRELMMELVYSSPLLTGEDWIRFHLMIEHMTDEAVIWVLNRFLNGHLEYIRVLQERCLERYPELGERVRSRLLKEASVFAKQLS